MMHPRTESTYQEYFANEANNPYKGDTKVAGYKATAAPWRTTGNTAAPKAPELLAHAALEFSQEPVGALGIFVGGSKENPGGVLKLCHGLHKYSGQPGQASVHKGKVFAFVGDVTSGSIQSIRMDQELFKTTEAVVAPDSVEAFNHYLTETTSEVLVGPIDDPNAKGVMKTKTRPCMFIPFELVPAVWNQDLNPHEALLRIVTGIRRKSLDEACGHLINWLLVACTSKAGTQSGIMSVVTQDAALLTQEVPNHVVEQRHRLLLSLIHI